MLRLKIISIIVVLAVLFFIVQKERSGKPLFNRQSNNSASSQRLAAISDQEPTVIKSYDFNSDRDFGGWQKAESNKPNKMWIRDGQLHLDREGLSCSIQNALSLDAADANVVAIRLSKRKMEICSCEVGWQTSAEGKKYYYRKRSPSTESEWYTIFIPIGESLFWDGQINNLQINLVSFDPNLATKSNIVKVDWIRLLRDDSQSFVTRPDRLGYAINGELAWLAKGAPANRLTREINIPPGAMLSFNYGLSKDLWLSPTEQFVLRVGFKPEKGQIEDIAYMRLKTRASGGPWRWARKVINLERFANQRGQLVFDVMSDMRRERGYVLWGQPTLASKTELANDSRPNVIVILIDALRPDHLGCYGYSRPTSPNIDKIAKDGMVFENAFAQSNCTHLSVGSILTSQFPLDVKEAKLGYYPQKEGVTTLMEKLAAGGYKTGLFALNPLIHWDYKYDAGCDSYFAPKTGGDTGLSDFALNWMRDYRRNRFFAYIHFMTVHSPYAPPSHYSAPFLPNDYLPADPDVRDGMQERPLVVLEKMKQGYKDREKDIEYLKGLYDGDITWMDALIGSFVGQLKQMDLYDNTVLIIIADHGEAFLEHGELMHGRQLYDEAIRVPLIVKLPSSFERKAERVDSLVRLVDVYPTILDLAELPIPAGIQGKSLLSSGSDGDRLVYAEGSVDFPDVGMATAVTRDWKYIKNTRNRGDELYNLAADPKEHHNLIAARPDKAVELQQQMQDMLRHRKTLKKPRKNERQLDKKTEEKLRSLGYVK
jgi:arylsulfatase A-like enzyme